MIVPILGLAWLVTAGAQAPAATLAAPDRPEPAPVSAHNCYPENSTSPRRLVEALELGIDNIEIDLGWDEAAGRLIVAHETAPRAGLVYPEFESYLVPALEAIWRMPRTVRAPRLLTIDWKTERPAAVDRFHAFLEAHPDWFSSAPKAAGATAPLTERRLTVCFSGSDRVKDYYDSLIPAGGTYRAFRDVVFGAGASYLDKLTDYVPTPSTAFHRFLAFHWSHVERGGPPRAGDWTPDEAARLEALVALAHRQGFRVRFYTLNGHTGDLGSSYRFVSDGDALSRWRAAAHAGADWVASDEYAEIVAALKPASAGRQ
jgi:hypothetical protein